MCLFYWYFFLFLQESWLTAQVCISTSSSPAVPLLSHRQCSSSWHFTGWIKRTRRRQSRVSRPPRLTRPDLLSTLLPAFSTAACPQMETKRRPQLTGRRISPASENGLHCVTFNTHYSLQIIPSVSAAAGDGPQPSDGAQGMICTL